MPHVQRAGDIGRWQLDAIGRALFTGRSRGRDVEVAALLPFGVPAGFYRARIEALFQFHGGVAPAGAQIISIIGKVSVAPRKRSSTLVCFALLVLERPRY